jgi:hypothetical protein
MKLFTIGDSISQGFMSAGAAKPQFSYSTLLAKTLGEQTYAYLAWQEKYHLKADLELILRTLEDKFGSNIRGLEWPFALKTVNEVLDVAEEYYEKGDGKLGNPVGNHKWFHSVAVEGMDVADAWLVTPNVCRKVIDRPDNKAARSDSVFGSASDAFYRNAYRVLNPQGTAGEQEFGNFSALDWLDYHAKNEGVDNTIVWLGANNALGTVVRLNVNQTPGDGTMLNKPREERQRYNLWHPRDFEAEYTELLARVDASMCRNQHKDWRVFVGTVPYVTIAPVAKGMGELRPVEDHAGLKGLYYQYYSYFPFSLETAIKSGKYLNFRDALHIDRTILEFNRIIKNKVAELNKKHGNPDRYHIVDMGEALSKMAWKRNKGQPTYEYPEELRFVYPPIDTKYYDVAPNGTIEGGGIFSLDGVHPTVTAHGIIAWEFMKVMQAAGAIDKSAKLDWGSILAADRLRNEPIRLLQELYQHDNLIRTVLMAIQLLRD